MTKPSGLVLDNCWSIPDLHVTFLQRGFIYAEFRNDIDQEIEILETLCRFQTEEGLSPYKSSVKTRISLKPHNRSQPPIQIPFVADLSLIPATNSYYLVAKCKIKESSEVTFFTYSPQYLIIHPIRPAQKHFFVSHKDPEDSHMAARLDHYLLKIGFHGYIAEKHKRPGLDIWHNKILPAIDESVALIALWTRHALRYPASMLRELDHGRKRGKKLILLVEKGASLPPSFPTNTEFIPASSKIDEEDLIDLVRSIEQTYRTGGY